MHRMQFHDMYFIYIYIYLYIYTYHIYIYIYMKSELGSPTAMMQTFASKGMRSWRLSCRTCRKRRCGCGKHWTTSGPSWRVWLVDVLVFGDWMVSVSLYCDSTSVASVSMAQWHNLCWEWNQAGEIQCPHCKQQDLWSPLPAPTHPSVFWNLPGNPGSQVLQIPVAGPKSFAAAGCYVCSSDQGLHIYELLRIYVCVCVGACVGVGVWVRVHSYI